MNYKLTPDIYIAYLKLSGKDNFKFKAITTGIMAGIAIYLSYYEKSNNPDSLITTSIIVALLTMPAVYILRTIFLKFVYKMGPLSKVDINLEIMSDSISIHYIIHHPDNIDTHTISRDDVINVRENETLFLIKTSSSKISNFKSTFNI